jgi:monoamine oxidase
MIDVAIVGAGLAGLACARAVVKTGATCVVVEARDRVGGRTLSRTMGEATFDLGAQWIGPTQDRMEKLSHELGVATFPTFHEGRKVLDLDGKISTYAGTIPSLSLPRLLELQRVMSKVDRMSAAIDLEAPERSKRAALYDAETLEGFKRRSIHSHAVQKLLDAAVRVVFGAEPCDLSMLHFLFYLRSGGGLERLIEIEKGAQERRFVGGAQQIAIRMAAALGDRVGLAAPVRRVDQDASGVTVRGDGFEVRAKRCVVAVPPALAARIEYSPALPAPRDQLTQRMPMGATVKCIALYERPFWRARGLSGEGVANRGPASVVFDNTSHDARQAALLAFVVGGPAKTWSSSRSESDRRGAVLAQLARMFGDEALSPTEYVEHDWSTEVWTRGCPVGLMPTGVLTQFAPALRAPCGRIHWAGTETAITWHGFMEGALESGERAANEAMK